jgi:signal transduction histidine kinase
LALVLNEIAQDNGRGILFVAMIRQGDVKARGNQQRSEALPRVGRASPGSACTATWYLGMDEKVNILLVDDQPAKLLAYESMLGNLGENLIKAGSAQEALEQLLKQDIALVLADISMPEMDGFDLASTIREHPRFHKTAIIFVSGVYLTDQDRLKGYQLGAVDYVSVPVIPEVLCAKVRIFVELHRKTRQLSDSEKSLRRLSLHLLRSQDEERRRIGRDIHESLGQTLVAIKMGLDSVGSSLAAADSEAVQQLAECCRLAETAIKEARTISHLMYPPMLDDLGLKSAIAWYLEGFAQRSETSTTFEVSPDFGRLNPEAELAMFRILQESLTNVHRHSSSRTADVRLFRKGGMAFLEVIDHGRGIPSNILGNGQEASVLGVGLRGMEERVRHLGGKLEILSTSRGTKVIAGVPAGEAS